MIIVKFIRAVKNQMKLMKENEIKWETEENEDDTREEETEEKKKRERDKRTTEHH